MIMTNIRHQFLVPALLVVIAIAAFVMRGSAQTQQPSGSDVLPALLQEVHGLRAAMEQMASSNAHAQLLVGRLQLQEGRMNSMIRRLDTVRDEHAKAQTTYEQMRDSIKRLEGDRSANDPPQEQRDDMLAGLRHQVGTAKAAADRWAAEEAQLTSDLTAEQARWTDINQRLDELERSLVKR
jgi:chromosome segregation ATPase